MATLRDPLFRTSTVSDADMEAVNATAMNPITRA